MLNNAKQNARKSSEESNDSDAQQQTKKHKAVAVPQMIPNAAAAPTKVDEKSLSILTAAGVVKATGAAAAAAAASAILALRRPPVPLFVAGTSNTRPSSSAAGAAGASPKTAAAADAVKVLPKATPVPMASATKPLSVGFDAFDHEKVAPGAWSFWVQDTATVRVVCPLGGTRKRGFFALYDGKSSRKPANFLAHCLHEELLKLLYVDSTQQSLIETYRNVQALWAGKVRTKQLDADHMAMATVTMITDRRLFVLNVGSYDIVIFRETREGVMLAGHGLHQPSEVSRLATSIKPDAKADLARGDPNLPTRAFGPAKSYYYTVPPVIVSYSLEKDDQFMLICDDAFGRSCDNNYGVAGAYIRGYARQNMKCEMMARLLVDAVAGGRTPAFNGIMIVDLRPFVS